MVRFTDLDYALDEFNKDGHYRLTAKAKCPRYNSGEYTFAEEDGYVTIVEYD